MQFLGLSINYMNYTEPRNTQMKSDRAPEELVDLSRASLFLSVANAYLSVCRTAAFGKAGLPSPSSTRGERAAHANMTFAQWGEGEVRVRNQ